MKFELIVQRNWFYTRNQWLTPAVYRVPEDVSEDMALRCIKENVGKRVDPKRVKGPAPENKATAPDEVKKKALTGSEPSPSSRPRGRPRKDRT